MMTQEITIFCTNWLEKAKAYDYSTLQGAFDKFFTLFVVYNRLYVEATFRMSNNNAITLTLSNRTSFPDDKAAKVYSLQYLTSTRLNEAFNNSNECLNAIETLKTIIRENKFNIKLDMVLGTPLRQKDLDLLKTLESTHTDNKMKAITDILYSIRCNTFHGQKGYENSQIELLQPVCILLEKIIELLFLKLTDEIQ